MLALSTLCRQKNSKQRPLMGEDNLPFMSVLHAMTLEHHNEIGMQGYLHCGRMNEASVLQGSGIRAKEGGGKEDDCRHR